MKTKFQHHIQLSTTDPLVIYSTDQLATYKILLDDLYLHKVFKGCFVTDIYDIIIGKICTEAERTGGSVRITLGCTIEGIIYDINETIYDAEVVNFEKGSSIATMTSSSCDIGLKMDGSIQFIKPGDKIPVVCKNMAYRPLQQKVVIVAVPRSKEFVRSINEEIIVTINTISPFLMKQLTDVENEIKELDSKSLDAALKVLNKVKSEPKTAITISELLTNTGRMYSILRNDRIGFGSATVLAEETKEHSLDDESSDVAMQALISDIIKEKQEIVNFATHVLNNPLKSQIIKLYK